MTNYSVFNKSNSPLYTQMTNTYTSPGIESEPEGSAAKSGILYTLSSGSVSVPASQSLLLQAVNPAGSGKTMYVSRIMGGVTGSAAVFVYSGGTITGGTNPVPVNMLFGSTSKSSMTTKQSTGTLGATFINVISLPVSSGLYSIPLTGSIVVPAGQILTVTVGTGALTASINIVWWEF
ncbi:hypothetical protein N0M98_05485 [Paenibacillus doosanensis]|uniref:hypothetical protein n=1 Tax=Paenibacillus doosanensis TaxID=1229154 RepID=UPI002180516D|nr:hypothetical protein [Paenibacillus doosanensis]MCS7459587.1 hypothetical protein [Paenibacillus doosanensis]